MGSLEVKNILTSWATSSFWKRILFGKPFFTTLKQKGPKHEKMRQKTENKIVT